MNPDQWDICVKYAPIIGVIVSIIGVYIAYRTLKSQSKKSKAKPHLHIEKYRGSLKITTTDKYNVFYPVKFAKIPNLTVTWEKRCKRQGRFKLIDERSDGFVIRITKLPLADFRSMVQGGYNLNWEACAKLAENE